MGANMSRTMDKISVTDFHEVINEPRCTHSAHRGFRCHRFKHDDGHHEIDTLQDCSCRAVFGSRGNRGAEKSRHCQLHSQQSCEHESYVLVRMTDSTEDGATAGIVCVECGRERTVRRS
jgi:hypothetical protein